MLATGNTRTWTILHVCVLKAIKYAELQCLKNAVSTFIIAKWVYKSTIMSIIPAAKTRVHFKMTSLNLMEWCLSLFSVVYILCVFSACVHHQRSAVLHLGFLSWGGTLISWWIQGSFALPDVIWVHRDFFPLGVELHPHPSGPPPTPAPLQSWNMVISHSCCVKLVFLCGCDKHMVFCEERSLKTHNRDRSCFYPYIIKISNCPT